MDKSYNSGSRVSVRIMGRSYTLSSDNSREYTVMLAEELNKGVSELLRSERSLGVLDAAILFALNSLDESKRSTQLAENLRLQMGEYLNDASRERQRAESLKRENAGLKKRLLELDKSLRSRQGVDAEPSQKKAPEASSEELREVPGKAPETSSKSRSEPGQRGRAK